MSLACLVFVSDRAGGPFRRGSFSFPTPGAYTPSSSTGSPLTSQCSSGFSSSIYNLTSTFNYKSDYKSDFSSSNYTSNLSSNYGGSSFSSYSPSTSRLSRKYDTSSSYKSTRRTKRSESVA